MNSLVIGLIVVVGTLAAFIVALSLPAGDNIECDLDCKKHFESKGFSCTIAGLGEYECRQLSRHSTFVVFPYGAFEPERGKIIPQSIKVSIGINNTVTWTNFDVVPHKVISDDNLFESPILKPNQTWGHVFDKKGRYEYHSDPDPWLKGVIIVVPLDPEFEKGQPIFHLTYPQLQTEYAIYRESDSWGYISKVTIEDANTIHVRFSDETPASDELVGFSYNIGDKFVGGCFEISGWSQIYHYELEKAVTSDTPYAEFKVKMEKRDGSHCNFPQILNSESIVKSNHES